MKKLIVLFCLTFSLAAFASTGWSGRVVSSTGWSGKVISSSLNEFVKKSIMQDYQQTCMSAYKVYTMPIIIEVEEVKSGYNAKSLSFVSNLLNLEPKEFQVNLKIFNSSIRSYEDNHIDVVVSYDSSALEYNLEYLGDYDFSCY